MRAHVSMAIKDAMQDNGEIEERVVDLEDQDRDACGSNCSPWFVTGVSIPFMVTLFGVWLAPFIPQFGVVQGDADWFIFVYGFLAIYCIGACLAIGALQFIALPAFGKFKHPEDRYGYTSYIAPRLNVLFAIAAYTQPVLAFIAIYLAEINVFWALCVAMTMAFNDVLIVMVTSDGKNSIDAARGNFTTLIICQIVPFVLESIMLIYIPFGPNAPTGFDFVRSKQVLITMVVLAVTILRLFTVTWPAFALLYNIEKGACYKSKTHEDGTDDTEASAAASMKYTYVALNTINCVNMFCLCGGMLCVSLILFNDIGIISINP